MKKTIFNSDMVNNQIVIEREFEAGREMVWQAWTDPAILDQWWAPEPWKAVTQSMDFREGGNWKYYMQGPGGERHFCRMDYSRISVTHSYEGSDCFCDEQGKKIETFPSMQWATDFSDSGDNTRVKVVVSFKNREDLETIVKMGFKEGFEAAHGNLDRYLEKVKARHA